MKVSRPFRLENRARKARLLPQGVRLQRLRGAQRHPRAAQVTPNGSRHRLLSPFGALNPLKPPPVAPFRGPHLIHEDLREVLPQLLRQLLLARRRQRPGHSALLLRGRQPGRVHAGEEPGALVRQQLLVARLVERQVRAGRALQQALEALQQVQGRQVELVEHLKGPGRFHRGIKSRHVKVCCGSCMLSSLDI